MKVEKVKQSRKSEDREPRPKQAEIKSKFEHVLAEKLEES